MTCLPYCLPLPQRFCGHRPFRCRSLPQVCVWGGGSPRMWHADQLTAFFVSLPCWHVEKTPAGPNSVMCLLCFGVSGISWCSPVGAGRGQGGAVSGRPELLGAWRCSPGAPSQLTPVSLTRPPPRLTGSEVWREAKRGGLAVCLLWVRSPWQLPTKNCGALSTLPLY